MHSVHCVRFTMCPGFEVSLCSCDLNAFLLQFSLRISDQSSLKQIVSLDAGAPYVKFYTKASYCV